MLTSSLCGSIKKFNSGLVAFPTKDLILGVVLAFCPGENKKATLCIGFRLISYAVTCRLEEPETPEKRPLYVLPASGRRMAEDGEGCFDVEEFKPEPKYYERYFSQCGMILVSRVTQIIDFVPEMIGKGSFAEVYRVIRRSDGAEFAVKISRHLLKGRSAWEKMASDFVYKGQVSKLLWFLLLLPVAARGVLLILLCCSIGRILTMAHE